ncbi:tripartite tricarboxylate transporter substrate binding protein [Diaphorobacter sp. HDW4A]|uniref:Bug family tripartite tricarboxylate transporter substrate binding protein n=1 Tax=Diaphorobacter sp. HDW4A TaxID=2714924 RepID=UPI00140C40FD|nr:tripartite tricarboxylate transporter substrate binding protein [Diaphorobacter sp. HDW4A]QIL80233.1 tripartite tricarboxylate transporter substrate binding protein [Diaphorobacter sp. HDW4A]
MELNRRQAMAAMGALGSIGFSSAQAQSDWPNKPVKLVMPLAAGGPTDVVGRALAAHIGRTLGQSVYVESKLGAAGNIGTEFVARAAPDGYTALYQTSGITIVPVQYKKLNFDPLRSFAPVAMPASINTVIVVSNDLPVKNFAEFVQYLKAHPGKLSYGSGGNGNITHLGIEVLLQMLGASAVHVPYKGTAPAMADLLGGSVQFMLDALSSSYPFIKDSRVRAIAVGGAQRSPLLPDVPTVAEGGLAGYAMSTWQCVLLPAGTPDAIVQKLNAAVNKAVMDPELQKQFSSIGVQLHQSTPAQFGGYMKDEVARWAQVAKSVGIQPE